ncbi:3-coathanger stack domain-containing protein [Emticicia fontis]
MKTNFTCILFLLLTLSNQLLKAQIEVAPKVIASAGGYSATGNLQVSWTLGETFITELTGTGLSATQGFQQNTSICVSVVDYQYVKAGNPYQNLFPLVSGMTINQIPEQVSILVTGVCSNVAIGSFEMNIQGPELNWNIIQNVHPSALFDNLGNNVYGRNFIPGNYTLTVTGYAEDNKGGGLTYGPVVTNFTVVGNMATISMPSLSTPNICAGSNVDVNFSASGTFNPGNQFQVQLSNPQGVFDNPVTIGTTNAAGTVNCTIPLNTPEGNNYLIRVVSSNQVYAGNPTMSQLKINPQNTYLQSPANDYVTGNTEIKQVVSTISAGNKVGNTANVTYQAGNAVVLTPGFETQTGGIFKAQIQACVNH